MITKQQAEQLYHGQELHFGGLNGCKRRIGPRGGIKDSIIRVRVSGKCQTWKTRPEEFRVPVKHGLYTSGELTHRNAAQFHFPRDCPIPRVPEDHFVWEAIPLEDVPEALRKPK